MAQQMTTLMVRRSVPPKIKVVMVEQDPGSVRRGIRIPGIGSARDEIGELDEWCDEILAEAVDGIDGLLPRGAGQCGFLVWQAS